MTEQELRQALVDKAASYVGCRRIRGEHKQFCDRYNAFVKANKTQWGGYPRSSLMDYSYAWCSCFASSVAIEMGYGMVIIPVEMSCCKAIREWMTIGSWAEDDNYVPSVGDYIYFDHQGTTGTDSKGIDTTDHVGIVEKVENGYIHTIEGNVSIGGFSCVGRKKYKVGAANISGFGVPDYAKLATESAPATTATANTISTGYSIPLYNLAKGNKGELVRTAQALLNLRSNAGLETDGSFGSLTFAAVKAYNSEHGISGNVINGSTWNHLLKGG